MEGNVTRFFDEVVVILSNGYKCGFFQLNLSDKEYLDRANFAYELDNKTRYVN